VAASIHAEVIGTVPGERPFGVLGDGVAAGLRYYGRLGKLTFTGVRALVAMAGERAESVQSVSPAPAPLDNSAGATMVLEVEPEKPGLGVFMVQNSSDARVTTAVAVSGFVDAAGRAVHPAVMVHPEVVDLEAHDQVLVRVTATADSALEPGVRYWGELTVPGLSDIQIPVVIRRPSKATKGASLGPPVRDEP